MRKEHDMIKKHVLFWTVILLLVAFESGSAFGLSKDRWDR